MELEYQQLFKGPELVSLSQSNNADFEKAYINVRKVEQRVLDDQQVLELPSIANDHPHFKEWKIRQRSANRIIDFLKKTDFVSNDVILDIGCGNGWFSGILADSLKVKILAIDINTTELIQAARVFQRDNLCFAYLDMMVDSLIPSSVKRIIFNSSFQYFEEPKKIVDICLRLLTDDGEIHILDSPLYEIEEIESAKTRSSDYYSDIGNQAMNRFYHHHSLESIAQTKIEFLYEANSKNKDKYDSPFPWYRIYR